MKVLDLFSGIGGFSLGLERVGMTTVAFCEQDAFCRRVLNKHWPHVPIYDDVRTLTGERVISNVGPIDLICGGFPCQDISYAGKGAGIEGERSGLWSEYARLIGELRPRYALVENVTALRTRGMGVVLGDLAALGYDAEWHCVGASHVGLPHRRDRIWIIAYDRRKRKQRRGEITLPRLYQIPWRENERRATNWRDRSDLHEPRLCGSGNGIRERLDRVGNAVAPQIPEIIGRAIMESE